MEINDRHEKLNFDGSDGLHLKEASTFSKTEDIADTLRTKGFSLFQNHFCILCDFVTEGRTKS